MVGKLRPGELESLDWLGLSSDDRSIAVGLASASLTNIEETWLNLDGGHFFDLHAAYYEALNKGFKSLVDSRGIISREEIQEVIDGSHDSYSNEGSTSGERLHFLFCDLASGVAVPQKLYDKWLSLLQEAGGDYLKAIVLAEFNRPAAES